MATPDECRAAIVQLAQRFGQTQANRADRLDRSVSAEITDVALRFQGHLHDGVLDEISEDGNSQAQIRLTMTSDDLVELAAGRLSLGSAWLAGRVKVHASFPDMLRLRSML